MAKLTVPINSAGGNIGPIKDKVYEKKKIVDNYLGIKTGKTYKLKSSGINQYEGFPEASWYATDILENYLTGSTPEYKIFYQLTAMPNSDEDTTPAVIYFHYDRENYQNIGYEPFIAVYLFELDQWGIYEFDDNTEQYSFTPLTSEQLDLLTFNIDDEYAIKQAGILASMIDTVDGQPFIKKQFSYVSTTVEEHNRTLKNWYYEDGEPSLLKVPKWDEVNINDNVRYFYEDDVNEVLISMFITKNDKYLLQVRDGINEYKITNDEDEGYNINTWYLNNEILESGYPDTKLYPEQYLNVEYIDLFNAIYGTNEITLDEKLKEIASIPDDSILKNKVYDYIADDNIIDGETYKFKENIDSFFTKYSSNQLIYRYVAPESPIAGEIDGGRGVNDVEEEYVLKATDIVTIYLSSGWRGDYIGVETANHTTYVYYQSIGWDVATVIKAKSGTRDLVPAPDITPSDENNVLPPNLTYNEKYVVNKEMLLAILDITKSQTLGEKFDEGIKKWNYENNLKTSIELLDIPDWNKIGEIVELNDDTKIYDNDDGTEIWVGKFEDYYGASFLEVYVISNFTSYYIKNNNCTLYDEEDEEEYNEYANIWYSYREEAEKPNPVLEKQYIYDNNNDLFDAVVSSPKVVTMEEKIKDLQNWDYEIGDTTLNKTIDVNGVILANNSPTIYDDYENGISIELCSDNNYGRYFRYIDTYKDIYYYYYDGLGWQDESENPVDVSNVSFIYKKDCVYKNFQGEAVYFDILKKIIKQNSVTLKEKFNTCLTLERLSNISIEHFESISDTEWNDSEYSTDYSYVATINDEAFKDALKVEVLFSLTQINSGYYCSLQEIDTENGALTIFSKNDTSFIINRIDIFKNVTTLKKDSIEEEVSEDTGGNTPQPSPDPSY